ncbi:DNA glycosylase AlkZ-like family protein [Tessaracoccus coleopterorum]|uniref:DNA glycosylase AlkZ-like family protein n=1 Tax=Tessaracoccus coleopterorum TaxID=2714950 RepID=UPI0018D49630|nr:crosslink repair DNA glycosylase YcaQ family protein [Tessaracoccus coleopterorum]
MRDDHHRRLVPGNNGVFKRSVVVGGRVVGTWTRTGAGGRRKLQVDAFEPITEATTRQLEARFSAFPFVTP